MQKKLTILIPTKNRLEWLRRAFSYYSLKKISFQILIGDSSVCKTHAKIKKLCSRFGNLNIKLYYFPKHNTEKTIELLSNYIKTPYAVFVADDDILMPNALKKSLQFLEKSKKTVAVTGRAKLLSIKNSKPFGKILQIHDYKIRGITNSTSSSRVSNYLNNITNINFAVMRTVFFKKYYKFVCKLPKYYQTYFFGEVIPAMWLLGKGKFAMIDDLYIVRQGHDENLFHKINIRKFFFENDLKKALQLLNKELEINFKYSKKIFSSNQNKVVVALLKIFLKKNNKNIFNIYYNKIIILVKRVIKYFLRRDKNKKYSRDFLDYLKIVSSK